MGAMLPKFSPAPSLPTGWCLDPHDLLQHISIPALSVGAQPKGSLRQPLLAQERPTSSTSETV